MSFDKCLQLDNHTIRKMQNVSITLKGYFELFEVKLYPEPQSIHWSPFCHCTLILSLLEFAKIGIIQYVLFCIWFLLLNVLFLQFIHVVTCIGSMVIIIFLITKQYSTVWIHHNLLICQTMDFWNVSRFELVW